MPVDIGREQVRSMQARGAQVVEVLSERQYREVHISGAVHIPLSALDEQGAAGLDRRAPVIPYCYDYQ